MTTMVPGDNADASTGFWGVVAFTYAFVCGKKSDSSCLSPLLPWVPPFTSGVWLVCDSVPSTRLRGDDDASARIPGIATRYYDDIGGNADVKTNGIEF